MLISTLYLNTPTHTTPSKHNCINYLYYSVFKHALTVLIAHSYIYLTPWTHHTNGHQATDTVQQGWGFNILN